MIYTKIQLENLFGLYQTCALQEQDPFSEEALPHFHLAGKAESLKWEINLSGESSHLHFPTTPTWLTSLKASVGFPALSALP